jgi:hypothetical protein
MTEQQRLPMHPMPHVAGQPTTAAPRTDGDDGELDAYDAGLLGDFGGGNVDWWQDYIRAELGRAHDHYNAQAAARITALSAEVERLDALADHWYTKYEMLRLTLVDILRSQAALGAKP